MRMRPNSATHTTWVSTVHLNRLARIVPIIVTTLLLGVLASACSWQNVTELWHDVHPIYLLFTLGLVTAAAGLGAISLLLLFGPKEHPLWWARFTLDYLYVQALCQLTPAQAGEIALPYIARRSRFAPGEIAASLVIQRMVAFWLIVLLAIAGGDRLNLGAALWFAAAVGASGCASAAFLIASGPVRNRVNRLADRYVGPVLGGFHDTWRSVFRKRRTRLALHILLMAARLAVTNFALYAAFMALGITPPLLTFAGASAVAMLAAMVPISVNGIGVVEGVFVTTLAGMGYGTERVLIASLASRIVSIAAALGWAGLYWAAGHYGKSQPA